MNIYVDVDGVLCNFVDRFLNFFKVPTTVLNQENRWPKGDYDLYKLSTHRPTELPPDEWKEMSTYPGASRLFNIIKSYGHILNANVYIITVVPTEIIKNIRQKWVFDHFTTHPIVLVDSGSRRILKSSIYPKIDDILIDDSEKELDNWGGHKILVPRPWNRADGEVEHVIDQGLTRIRLAK